MKKRKIKSKATREIRRVHYSIDTEKKTQTHKKEQTITTTHVMCGQRCTGRNHNRNYSVISLSLARAHPACNRKTFSFSNICCQLRAKIIEVFRKT